MTAKTTTTSHPAGLRRASPADGVTTYPSGKTIHTCPNTGEPVVTLPNGARIIKERLYSSLKGDRHLTFVLCRFWEHGNGRPRFATWVYNASQRGAENGHYFDNIDAAESDFFARRG